MTISLGERQTLPELMEQPWQRVEGQARTMALGGTGDGPKISGGAVSGVGLFRLSSTVATPLAYHQSGRGLV